MVTDVDSANLASAQVRLTNILDVSAESLAVAGCHASITVTAYNGGTGVLALSGSSSLANYQACLRAVTYNNTDQDPDATNRSIEWTVNDGALNNSPLAFTTLSVTPVNDRPVIDLNGAGVGNEGINNTASFTEDGPATTLAPAALVTDVDSANLASAQVRLDQHPRRQRRVAGGGRLPCQHHRHRLQRRDRRAGPERQLVAGQLPGLPAGGDLQQHRSGSGCHQPQHRVDRQ